MLDPDSIGLDTAIHDRSFCRLLPTCPRDRPDSHEHLGNYIKSLKDGCFTIYPYVLDFCEFDCDNNSYNSWFNSDEGNSFYGDDYVILGLRGNYRENRGSGGTYDVLPNNFRVATKFTAEHNSRKRRKIEQKEADVIAAWESTGRQEEVRRLKQKEDELERLRREKEQAERDAEVAKYTRQSRRNNDITQERHQDARKMAAERRRINELVTQYIDKLQASLTASRAREDQVLSLRTRLEKELRILCHPNIKVSRFGSFVSGLCSKKSNADMAFLDVGAHGLTIEDLAATLRQIQFHNFAIRQIAQKHGILSGSTGYLSSYALAVMLIVFLQHETEPAILPKLKGKGNCHSRRPDYSFDKDWDSYQGFGLQNTKSAGELLIDFLKYFGHTFNYDTQEVNSRSGAVALRSINSISPPTSDRTRILQETATPAISRTSKCASSKSCSVLFLGDIDTAFRR
ncbi:Zinc finger, CCHC domain-containing protein [Mortierella hygrophila]|uniref:Zinc finger, CCHC domain-containing protein n=1 Tax=Mortierella hygrophila TaxID=979708 RepID=A0A9P6FAI1_9FUNG|nr:Zinc finger, CCHC domain-containing protein [Mortierella hygrophila]